MATFLNNVISTKKCCEMLSSYSWIIDNISDSKFCETNIIQW